MTYLLQWEASVRTLLERSETAASAADPMAYVAHVAEARAVQERIVVWKKMDSDMHLVTMKEKRLERVETRKKEREDRKLEKVRAAAVVAAEAERLILVARLGMRKAAKALAKKNFRATNSRYRRKQKNAARARRYIKRLGKWREANDGRPEPIAPRDSPSPAGGSSSSSREGAVGSRSGSSSSDGREGGAASAS
jgi:hypothetical protein